MRRSLVLLLLTLLLLIVAIFLYIYYQNQKKIEFESKTRSDVLVDLNSNLTNATSQLERSAERAGIDPEDMKNALSDNDCALLPVDGKCMNEFVLKDGCCELYDDLAEVSKDAYNAAVSKLLKQIGTSIIADQLLTQVIPRMIKRGDYIAKLSKLLPRNTKATSKITARVVARIAARLAKKMAIRMAVLTLKLLSKLSAGPVGWALLIFDIFTVILDIGDTGNYDSFISNENLIKMRNQIVYKVWEARRKDGADLPILFPFNQLFPTESEEAERLMSENFMTLAIGVLAESSEHLDLLTDLLIMGLGEETNQETDEKGVGDDEIEEMMSKVVKLTRAKHGAELDNKLYNELIRIIKNRTPEEKSKSIYNEKDVMLVPSMSSETEIGITVTESGSKKWNTQKESLWFEYNDPFFPKPEPENYEPPFYASFSDTYYTLNVKNPGTLSNPNIIKKSVSKPVTFLYPFGKLFTMCEKSRTSAKYKKPINPRDYGVYLDNKTGICNYTKDYCNRYGLDHKSFTTSSGDTYHDCKLSKGQEALEFIFGTTVTRGSKREWQDRVDAYNSGDPDKIALTTALMIVDPTGVGSVLREQNADNYKKNKEKYGTATAVAIAAAPQSGLIQPFIENMQEKVEGREKFCEAGDECKRFHAKHRGGNFMTWSVRNKDGDVYSKGQSYQKEVKHNEDHVFFLPKDGYFKVSCNPGQKRNFTYDEVSDPFRVSCWAGQIDTSDRSSSEVLFAKVGGAAKERGGALVGAAKTGGEALAGAAKTGGEALVDVAETGGDALAGVVGDIGDTIAESSPAGATFVGTVNKIKFW